MAEHRGRCVSEVPTERRRFLRGLAAVVGTAVASELPPREIVQPAKADREHFMRRAFEMQRIARGRGDQNYGALVVKNGQIVGEGVSGVIVKRDPTAHAEMEAIRDAARRLGTNDLSGCDLYGTAKSCAMCETAAYWANISRILYGQSITDHGPPRYPSC